MPTLDEDARQPAALRLRRLSGAADGFAAATHGRRETVLARRPGGKNQAVAEIVCHLRDADGLRLERLALAVAVDDPKFPSLDPGTPDRWAEEDRRYLRNEGAPARAACGTRREETLACPRAVAPEGWTRGGLHPRRGWTTVGDFVTLVARHDDNPRDQLGRALKGRP